MPDPKPDIPDEPDVVRARETLVNISSKQGYCQQELDDIGVLLDELTALRHRRAWRKLVAHYARSLRLSP